MGASKKTVSAFLITQQNTPRGNISKHLAGNKIANGLRLPFGVVDARAASTEAVRVKG